jgi:Asp-tRNA(Asn)/Glu-tRNA(Gln) amidotransferase A subunit family amidase
MQKTSLVRNIRQAMARATARGALIGMLAGMLPAVALGQAFQVEESTIGDVQRAIQEGRTTCKQVVQGYIDRVKAYNGVCTRLVTKDGAAIPRAKGVVRAGAPLNFPTDTIAAGKVFPDLDQYAGTPLDFGRMEPTISDPGVQQQFGLRAGVPNADQLNALETLNIRGERSISCKAKCDTHPSKGALPASCPKACDAFRKQPDALERAAELDALYGAKPDLEKLPMYCAVFSWKNWYDATDMRATGGHDVNFSMDAPRVDSPDIAQLRAKGAISFAIANAARVRTQGESSASPKVVMPNGGHAYAIWGGQPCNPYDTERVPRGSSSGSGVSVGANLVGCSICEQSGASCKGPASRNNVVNLLTTKGIIMDGGMNYQNLGDRAGIHCRTVEDATRVLDAIKGYESRDMYSALSKALIPKEPYASFLVKGAQVKSKPLQGMRIGVVREFMVKHAKNDAAISDQIDNEIKTVLRDQLGAELVESVDPLYPDDPAVPNMKYTFQDAIAEILAANIPEYFWQTTGKGELEFAVPGYDVRTVEYALALSLGKAPLSDKLTLRRLSKELGSSKSSLFMDKYLAERGDERIKDWPSWVANSKWDSHRAGSEDSVGVTDDRDTPDSISYMKMQTTLRLIVLKVMYENGIDAFVNPENTLPPFKLGGPEEPVVRDRDAMSCCSGFTAVMGGPEMDVPAGYTRTVYEPKYALSADKKRYVSVTGAEASVLPHPMPISLMIWAGPGGEPAVIKAASAYESATHHRVPPPAFGPLRGEP